MQYYNHTVTLVCLQSAQIVSTQKDVSTGAVTRISKLQNQEAKSTKTVRRHNTETREMKFSDFTYAENDAEIMNSARDIIKSKMNREELVKQWKTNHDGEIRAKNKAKQREIWEKRWGEFLTPHREPKDPEMSATISMGYNTTGTSTYTKEL